MARFGSSDLMKMPCDLHIRQGRFLFHRFPRNYSWRPCILRIFMFSYGNDRVAKNAEFVPPFGLGAAMYIRPLLLGTGAELGLHPGQDYVFVVYVTPGTSSKYSPDVKLAIITLAGYHLSMR